MTILQVKNLTVSFGKIIAVEDTSFEVNEGEIVSIIGPNGAGKSTTLKAICGLVKITKGSIKFKNEEISNTDTFKIVKKGIIMVPQNRLIFESMTVEENLEVALLAFEDNSKSSKNDIEMSFELFSELKIKRKEFAKNLSGGEQQMLAIARALILKPKILMLDEPSNGMSPIYTQLIFNKIKQINETTKTTFIIVEQNIKKAIEISNEICIFRNNRMILKAEPQKILKNMKDYLF